MSFSEFETYQLRYFELWSGEKVSCCVQPAKNVCCFEVKLQHIVKCVPQRWWNCFVWKNRKTDLLSLKQLSVLLIHKKCVQTQEMPCIWPKIFLSRWTYFVALGRKFSILMSRGCSFSDLIGFCFTDYPRS